MKRVFALLFVSLFAVGCAQQFDPDDQPPPKPPSTLPPGVVALTAAQQKAVGLQIAPARVQMLSGVLTLPASIETPAGASAVVAAPVEGYVELPPAGLPALGSTVRAGQILARIHEAFTRAELVQLQSQLSAAQADVASTSAQVQFADAARERSRQMFEARIESRAQWETDQAAAAQAEAAAANAVAQRQHYQAALAGPNSPQSLFEVRAPVSGVLTTVSLATGQLVQTGAALFTIVNPAVVWVDVPVPEADIAPVESSPTALLTAAAYPDRPIVVDRLTSTGVADPSTRTIEIIYRAHNAPWLRPGMTATVALQQQTARPRLAIPATAIVHEATRDVVFITAGPGHFRQQPVTVEFIRSGTAAIASGLAPGAQVVTSGAALLESQLRRDVIQVID